MTVYTNTARFDTARALTEDEMFRIAPSIFAREAHASRSDRFEPIPTIEVLRGLQAEGFMPVGVQQSKSRDESKRDFTKHMIRMRKLDDDVTHRVGDTVCEIVLKNANDGTSAYDLDAGLFRIRCLNSLVAQTGSLEQVKVRHTGDVQSKVIEGTFTVLEAAHKALEAPDRWSNIQLNDAERGAFAKAAHTVRFDEDTHFNPEHLLNVRRSGDQSRDLWTTFNVIQENALKGGLRTRGISATTGRPRNFSTRAVKNIDGSVKLNKALWVLAEEMAALKS